MIIKFKHTIVFFCLFILGQSSVIASPQECSTLPLRPQVVLAIPSPKNSGFWDEVAGIAEAVSNQLNIDVKIHYFDQREGKRFNYLEFLDSILSQEVRAQYLISFFIEGIEKDILNLANKHNVKLFSFNSPLTIKLEESIGLPRINSPTWIGHVSSDEIKTGYDLANFIIEIKKQEKQKINLLAFIGNNTAHIAEMRALGLQSRIAEDENIRLLQMVKTNWSYQQTREKMSLVLKRFSDIDVIWCASDTIARAVVDEIKKSKPTMLNNVVIGSIDWSHQIIPYLKNNKVSVSYGGHMFDITHLLVLLYDYHNGIDFTKSLDTVIINKNSPLTGENVNLLNINNYNKLNVRSFSRCHSSNPKTNKYSAYELITTDATITQ